MVVCRHCKEQLTDENWSQSLQKYDNKLCKNCDIKRAQNWQKRNPEKKTKNPKGYMTNYMRQYREKNRDKIREIVRVEQHRRKRELSTEVILNEWFKGSHLHHMTPSIAIYIPNKLHRSVYHVLKTGVGMEEINAKVLNWLTT